MGRELDFERPVIEIERQIEELRRLSEQNTSDLVQNDTRRIPGDEELSLRISDLEARAKELKQQIFSRLSRWQIVQLARHPERPYTLDYVASCFEGFQELHGDRAFKDDQSIVGGIAWLGKYRVMLIGLQKGRTTQQNMLRNFGMPRPEGYRKALRLMKFAQRFNLPVVSMIDTPGAFPGIEAEERGQAQAIAEALEGMAGLTVPAVSVIIGEGGSGGALAVAVANRVLMLEFSIYSVISPEGCASILFKDAGHAPRAADALRLTAPDLLAIDVVDGVVPEPVGGAHRDYVSAGRNLRQAVIKELDELSSMSEQELVEDRYQRFRRLGVLVEPSRLLPSFGRSN